MFSLFQLFEFSYQDGLLFYDRSGMLSRRLQDILPGLTYKSSTHDQLDMSLGSKDVDLFFGIGVSHIQTLEPNQTDFPSTASKFLQCVSEILEIGQLQNFRFRYVFGKPCATTEDAQKLMLPLIPDETKVKLKSVTDLPQWRAVQAEFVVGNLAFESRTAIVELAVHRKLAAVKEQAGTVVPHITIHLDVRGLTPISVAEFDAEAFMRNVSEKQAQEILSKLAPHLS